MDAELEHGLQDLLTNVTGDEPTVTGKIALSRLKEFPDYDTRLARNGGRGAARSFGLRRARDRAQGTQRRRVVLRTQKRRRP
jgi:hypothetical protein